MGALRSATYSVVALDPTVISDRAFSAIAIDRIAAQHAAGEVPVLVAIADSADSPSAADLARFVNGLTAQGVPASLMTCVQMDALAASGSLVGVPLVLPCAQKGRSDDAYAIGLAARLGCPASFWTRSNCVQSANPQHVDDTSVVEHVSFVELMELANGGQDAVDADATQLAWATNTKFKIVALDSGRWTSVTHDTYTKRVRPVASIAVRHALTLIEARIAGALPEDAWRLSSAVLKSLAQNNLRIEQMQVLPDGLRLACDNADEQRVLSRFVACGFEPRLVEHCAKICIVGAAMASASGVLHSMMTALAAANVRPYQVSDSNVTASFLVAEGEALAAERAMHDIFSMRERVTSDKQIAFDATTRILHIPDRSEKLGTRQAKLLNLLLENAGKIVDIETASRHLFGEATPSAIAALRVHVHNLRKKIEDDPVDPQYILTIPNRGYTFARQWSSEGS